LKLTIEEKESRKQKRKQDKYDKEHKIIDGVNYKKCGKHDIHFPEESPWFPCTDKYFYVNNSNGIDGLSPWCKRCSVVRSNINTLENYDRFLQSQVKYRKTEKNRDCQKEKHKRLKAKGVYKNWADRNPEKIKGYTNKHRDHDIEESEWISCQEFFDYCCAYCGKTLEDQLAENKEQFHKEHKDHDGYNDVRNCIPACTNCNSSKRIKTFDEFFESGFIKEFTQDKYNKIVRWTTEEYKKYITDKPPYRIKRKRREGLTTYYWQLWSVDEKRNMVNALGTGDKKKDLDIHIKRLFPSMRL